MNTRRVTRRVPAQAMREGAGVTIHRTIGTPTLRHLDPFLLLDFFSSDDPNDYIAGFPDHPHRGFSTVTYMLDGRMRHQDSMGNRGDLGPGDVQWMKAASGVIHSEMPQQESGLMRGFQLWVNLPRAEKMSEPAYQEFAAGRIPVAARDGVQVKVICGSYAGCEGPVRDPATQVVYFDVTLSGTGAFEHQVAAGCNAFIYVYDGAVHVQEQEVATHELAVLGDGDSLRVATRQSARFIFVAGQPIGEPVVQYGPFVMSTSAEIQQALQDYRDGRLARNRAAVTS